MAAHVSEKGRASEGARRGESSREEDSLYITKSRKVNTAVIQIN